MHDEAAGCSAWQAGSGLPSMAWPQAGRAPRQVFRFTAGRREECCCAEECCVLRAPAAKRHACPVLTIWRLNPTSSTLNRQGPSSVCCGPPSSCPCCPCCGNGLGTCCPCCACCASSPRRSRKSSRLLAPPPAGAAGAGERRSAAASCRLTTRMSSLIGNIGPYTGANSKSRSSGRGLEGPARGAGREEGALLSKLFPLAALEPRREREAAVGACCLLRACWPPPHAAWCRPARARRGGDASRGVRAHSLVQSGAHPLPQTRQPRLPRTGCAPSTPASSTPRRCTARQGGGGGRVGAAPGGGAWERPAPASE